MFVKYKMLVAVVALGLTLGSVMAQSESVIGQSERIGLGKCDSNNQCAIVLPGSTSEVGALCPGGKMSILWNKGEGWRLVSCFCGCTEQNNKNWFISPDGKVLGLQVGRFFNKNIFSEKINPVIPDLFHSHEMCASADLRLLGKSSFILLDKVPSNKKRSILLRYYICENFFVWNIFF